LTKAEVYKSTNKIDVNNVLKQLEYEMFEKNKVFKSSKLSSLFEGLYHEFNDLSIKKEKLKIKLIDSNNYISALKSELERKTAEKKDNCLCDLKNFEILSLKKIIDEITENYSNKCLEMEEFLKQNNKNKQNIDEDNNLEEKLKALQLTIDEKDEYIFSLKANILQMQADIEKRNIDGKEITDFTTILKKKEDIIDQLSSKILKLNNTLKNFKEFHKFNSSDTLNLFYQFNIMKTLQENTEKLNKSKEILQNEIENYKNTINDLKIENQNLTAELTMRAEENNKKSNDNFNNVVNNEMTKDSNQLTVMSFANRNSIVNEEIMTTNDKLLELEAKFRELSESFDVILRENEELRKNLSPNMKLFIQNSIEFSINCDKNEENIIRTPHFKDFNPHNILSENEGLKSKLNKLIIIEQNYELVKYDFNNLMKDYNIIKENLKSMSSTDLKLKLIDKDREIRDLESMMFELVRENNDLKKDNNDKKAKNSLYREEKKRLARNISESELFKSSEIKRNLYLNDNFNNNVNLDKEYSNKDLLYVKKNMNLNDDSIETIKGKSIFSVLDNRRIVRFNTISKSFKVNFIQDLGNFDKSFNFQGFLQLNVNEGLLILTGENNDTLFYYNGNKNSITKLSKLKDNHSNGGLFYYKPENSIFALSGMYNKIVEKCYEFNSNNGNHKVLNWIHLNDMRYERAFSPYVVLNENYLYTFLGYNYKTNQYLDSIERLYLLRQTQWEIVNYFKNNLFSPAKKGFATLKVSEEDVLFVGGFNGETEESMRKFTQYSIKDNQFYNLDEYTLGDIDKNYYYSFQKNTSFTVLNQNDLNIFFNFDDNNYLHVIDGLDLKHETFKCE
jgi:hypothetical protein